MRDRHIVAAVTRNLVTGLLQADASMELRSYHLNKCLASLQMWTSWESISNNQCKTSALVVCVSSNESSRKVQQIKRRQAGQDANALTLRQSSIQCVAHAFRHRAQLAEIYAAHCQKLKFTEASAQCGERQCGENFSETSSELPVHRSRIKREINQSDMPNATGFFVCRFWVQGGMASVPDFRAGCFIC